MTTAPGRDGSSQGAHAEASARPNAPIDGCAMFPTDNVWNARVDDLPVDAQSAAYVATIGSGVGMHPDFGAGLWNGGKIGIPYTTVGSDQAGVALSFTWPNESDPGPYPIPTDAPIEGPPGGNGDRHILVVDRDVCRLYEVYHAYWQPDGSIQAGSGAVFDLASNALRPAGWTSADAAGLPILAGLARYDDVATGRIDHALRFTVPETRKAYIWPGRHQASDLLGTEYPPMGQRFRLKAGVDISGLGPQAQVIAQALKDYGMILADNGSAWYLSGAPDERWDDDDLHTLGHLKGSDFEAVDESALIVDIDSGQVSVPGPSATPTDLAVPTTAPPPTITPEPSTTPTPEATETPSETTTAPAPSPSDTPPTEPTAGATATATEAAETPTVEPSVTSTAPPSATPSTPEPTVPATAPPTPTLEPAGRLWLPALHTPGR